ncbi:hypothetical protein LT85_1863 [Collimonas arenae]|uniref:Uncharacterized protein n=1 Tax=Collimonas arenae TaxID=279058 RepID=A0A0A1F905_9BURK|nr:hypothetical protein [Collimonas arenae]AIY41021.1 hypothetical protein LT85_1863 [Collimonas arenae]
MDLPSAQRPEMIQQVKSTRYSIARRYGRVTIEGHTYVYERSTDTLMRQDAYHRRKQSTCC